MVVYTLGLCAFPITSVEIFVLITCNSSERLLLASKDSVYCSLVVWFLVYFWKGSIFPSVFREDTGGLLSSFCLRNRVFNSLKRPVGWTLMCLRQGWVLWMIYEGKSFVKISVIGGTFCWSFLLDTIRSKSLGSFRTTSLTEGRRQFEPLTLYSRYQAMKVLFKTEVVAAISC